jgi:hypothetical protein
LAGTFRDRLRDRSGVVHRVDLVRKLTKQGVFKVKRLRNLIFFIRRRALYRAKMRRLELARRIA